MLSNPLGIRNLDRALIGWRWLYIWGFDGRSSGVWRYRLRPSWLRWPDRRWRACGPLRRAWIWAVWRLPQAVGCRSFMRYDKCCGGKDL